jgi:hypothetical protein
MNDPDRQRPAQRSGRQEGRSLGDRGRVNRPSYIAGFYAGEATVADNWLPAGAQYYKREYLPTYNVTASRATWPEPASRTTGLNVDLWYPTGAPPPSCPIRQGAGPGDRQDLTRWASRSSQERGLLPYLADAANGKLPMWIQSQSCRWAGAG